VDETFFASPKNNRLIRWLPASFQQNCPRLDTGLDPTGGEL
jgi:hypothetical protein